MGRVKQRLARHELHDDEQHPINLAEIVNPDQIRVVEAGRRAGLLHEARHELGVLGDVRQHAFGDGLVIGDDLPLGYRLAGQASTRLIIK